MNDQAEFHQLMLERQERIEEALYHLAMGGGGREEIDLLADELRVKSPYKRKEHHAAD